MSSSRNILRDTGNLAGFMDKLKTTHQVQDELPHNRYAKSQLEARFAEAQEQGFSEGLVNGHNQAYQSGLQEGKVEAIRLFNEAHHSEIVNFTNQLESLKNQAEEELKAWFANAENQLAVLAIEIAKQAIQKELSINQETVVEIAKTVLKETTEGTEFRIRVSLGDASILDSRKQEILEQVSHARNIEVVADQNIASGCVVETGSTVIDAQIDTYLLRLANSIRGQVA